MITPKSIYYQQHFLQLSHACALGGFLFRQELRRSSLWAELDSALEIFSNLSDPVESQGVHGADLEKGGKDFPGRRDLVLSSSARCCSQVRSSMLAELA